MSSVLCPLLVNNNKKKPRILYEFSKANFDAIRDDVKNLSGKFLRRNPENISLEDNWQFFKSGLLEITNQRVPSKRRVSWNELPWITRELKKSLRKKKRLYNTEL